MTRFITKLTDEILAEIRTDKELIGQSNDVDVCLSYFQYDGRDFFSIIDLKNEELSIKREDNSKVINWLKTEFLKSYGDKVIWSLREETELTPEEMKLMGADSSKPWREN